jgi:hypothetical protein
MKELRGTAAALVPAPPAQCLALVEAVDEYPSWHPEVVREVEVLERDARGLPSRARTILHLSAGPVTKDFDLLMSITVDPPATVTLSKIDGQGTRVEVTLAANLDVPRFLPLGGVGDSVAQGFVSAASAELARRARDS